MHLYKFYVYIQINKKIEIQRKERKGRYQVRRESGRCGVDVGQVVIQINFKRLLKN